MSARRRRLVAVAIAIALSLASRAALTDSTLEKLSASGPATFVIGTSFVLTSLATLPLAAATGGDTRLKRCRLAHGAKMTAAGVVLLPAGLLAAPFYPAGAATGFADGFADAFQEDTCSRPFGAVYP